MRGPPKEQRSKIAYIQKREDAKREEWKGQQHRENLEAINRIADELVATKQQEQRDDDKRALREKLTIILLFATVFAAGLGDIFFYGQMQEMQRAYEPIRDSAEAAKTAAEAATTQSEIATRQVESSERAAIQAQRAWVGPTNVRIEEPIEVQKPLNIVIDYTNSGREPALNFIYAVDIFAIATDELKSQTTTAKIDAYFKGCREAKTLRPGTVVFPTASNNITATPVKGREDFVDQDVIEGAKTVIIDGCLLYKTFEVIRHTYFCYYYTGKKTKPSGLNICDSGAGAD